MGDVITGFIILVFGFMMVWKSWWIVETFGKSSWAEDKLGSSGGTNLLYKLIGIIIMFLGMITIAGLKNDFLMSTIGKLFIGLKK